MTRQNIIAVRIGEIAVTKAILGLTTVMNTAAVYDTFSRSNRFLDDDGRWVNVGPATDYRAFIENTVVRVGIPDEVTESIEAVSYMRCRMGEAPADDGYVQCRVFTKGDPTVSLDPTKTYQTALFGKVNEDFTDGVGIHLAASQLSLVVRKDGTDNIVALFGQYSVNDVVRLNFVGKNYTVFCNGQERGSWSDNFSQVVSGEDHRFCGLRVHGAHEGSKPGPRQFSPALDFVEYG